MKTIPKGVLHHIHYFCTDDSQFVLIHLTQYLKHILSDPRIYLTKDHQSIEIGTREEGGGDFEGVGFYGKRDGVVRGGEMAVNGGESDLFYSN